MVGKEARKSYSDAQTAADDRCARLSRITDPGVAGGAQGRWAALWPGPLLTPGEDGGSLSMRLSNAG